jgi:hypothetical protein
VELPEEALETLDEFAWPLEDPPVVGEGTAFPEYAVPEYSVDPDESISWDVSELSLDAHRSVAEGDHMIAHSLQEAEVLAAAPVLGLSCPPGWTERPAPSVQRLSLDRSQSPTASMDQGLLRPDLERLHQRQQQALDRHYVRAASPRAETPPSPSPATSQRRTSRQPRSMADYLAYIMNPESNGAVLSPDARAQRLAGLPVHRATGVTEPCSICLDIGVGDEVAVLACGHVYHAACIHKWLAANDDCPLCKQPAFQTNGLGAEEDA